MDAFLSRKRRRLSPPPAEPLLKEPQEEEEDSTDVKLAILSSLNPDRSQDDLLEVLLSCDGSVSAAIDCLSSSTTTWSSRDIKRRQTIPGIQSAIPFSSTADPKIKRPSSSYSSSLLSSSKQPRQPLTRKGKTLHLYTPDDIATHTPCSIIHNFLPPTLATSLLHELLAESTSYSSISFKIFDNVVKSPHTACFYVDNPIDRARQRTEYYYNGNDLLDVRETLPTTRQVSDLVRIAVNKEIETRIRDFYPDGKKLRFQTDKEWQPNAAFVNCYDGGAQHVGYHSDQLTYLGPRAVIGSLSLGVAREFRVRRIVPKDQSRDDDDDDENHPPTAATATAATAADGDVDDVNVSQKSKTTAADLQGQISIHLPHNSLLVMHAEMQEEWKHSIAPASTIIPHPVASNKRINITYRWYRDEFRPEYTPRCRCDIPCVLKCVQRRRGNRGRYMWMCQAGNRPGAGDGCGWFVWANFTDDGVPIGWKGGGKQTTTSGNNGDTGQGVDQVQDDKEGHASLPPISIA
ncbi:hypothetical protein B0A52_06008 [Exophiala mesophila]|uniref:Fe2OG dioxygenase domain-containing protein n=1 Tax=Exophiala mesophila TaxID=212818 RepID=A0A438N518_EXOME|nr:hypothetical protein B0A52_06008 [Exophiala mesophila]